MLEVAPGIYISPDLSAGVRQRVWSVVSQWYEILGRGAITMIWRDRASSGGVVLRHLGNPPKEIRDADGVLLVKRS
ncbi:type I-E CRISPR-associated endoribonuclease Cas2e [Candidatus Foliamicus sp.]